MPGMVASSQRAATAVGASILSAGGNAADAAVAVAAALAVTEPMSTGIGGDCFALYRDAATGAITALNGSGRSPGQLTLERVRETLQRGGMSAMPPYHAHTVTVPGACAGWFDLIERHGSRPMAELLAPATALAEDGFAVGEVCAHFWAEDLVSHRGAANLHELSIDGRAPRAGERFSNPGMARTLRAVTEGGRDAFYRGEIARAIARVVEASGGTMAEADLAAHTSTWDEPISTMYRGMRIWECAPNGQGIAVLIALNLLEGFPLRGQDPLGADRLHLIIEALRLAMADSRRFVADPQVSSVPIAELLSKDYAARRRAQIDLDRASVEVGHGTPTGGDTVQFCTVDGAGNACSFINSNYMGFGTGIVPGGWGFPLQNRGHNFSLEPGHPNALAPNKRPYHTIIPGMITRGDGSLYAPFGVMGGFMQPQGHVQVVVAMLDDDAAPQAALDRPRLRSEPVPGSRAIALEDGIPAATEQALRARGHQIISGVTGFARSLFGRGQIIVREPDGRLDGGSDPRADGEVGVTGDRVTGRA